MPSKDTYLFPWETEAEAKVETPDLFTPEVDTYEPVDEEPSETALLDLDALLTDEGEDGEPEEDTDWLAALLDGSGNSVAAELNLERKAKQRRARRAGDVEVTKLAERDDVQARILAEQPRWAGEYAEPSREQPEFLSVDEQRKLAHVWFLSARAHNGCSIETLYTMRVLNSGEVILKCPRCRGNSLLDDMHEVAGFSHSYTEFDDCPQCARQLRKTWDIKDTNQRLAARQEVLDWCEENPMYNDEGDKVISCQGKGYILKFRPAWAHFVCGSCVAEHRAKATQNAARYT